MARVDMTLNPLVLFNLEFAGKTKIDLTHSDTLLTDICWDSSARTLSDLQARYLELREINTGFHMAPVEKWIQSKVVAPLRQAMANYILSNYLSTIALCGMAAEMIAMLIYDMLHELRESIPEVDRSKLIPFAQFERKGQKGRVDHIMRMQCIPINLRVPFDTVREVRRSYLHFYTKDISDLKRDALKCYRACCVLVSSILPHHFTGQGFQLSPALLEYLKKKGIARDE